ncbi:MAG: recombinase family protein [Moritella sp.]|nr:MAG: recombinase family protein [Moritella sp.]
MENEIIIDNVETRLAFIYSRVSKSVQSTKGGGITRQIEQSKKFINDLNLKNEKEGLVQYQLADDIIIDRGLSAYSGLNTAENGGLGAFLQAAKDGRIPPYSMLVVEAIDRISRMEPNRARMIFSELAKNKIDVAIQRFNMILYHDRQADLGIDVQLTVAFHMAYSESNMKSYRIKARFDKKREEEPQGGERRTSICPSWMTLSVCKTKFELIPDYSALLQRIYRMRIDDNLGSSRVAKILNSEGIKNFNGRTWSCTLIQKYWKMSQAIGLFQPTTDDYSNKYRRKIPLGDPIADYYPAAISKEDFAKVQLSFKKYQKGTKSYNYKNLFAVMLKCPQCGGTLSYSQVTRGQPKLRCRNYLDNRGCTKGSINYLPVEKLLVDSLSSINYTKLYKGNKNKSIETQLADTELQVNQHENKINELKQQLNIVGNAMAISALATELDKTCGELDNCKRQQTSLLQSFSIPKMPAANQLDLTTIESRSKYNYLINGFVDYIVVSEQDCIVVFKGNVGAVQLFLHNRYNKLRDRGYLVGKDIIDAKFMSEGATSEHKGFQVDLNALVQSRNEGFNQLTRKAVPASLDYLASIKFVFNAMQDAGLSMSHLKATSFVLSNKALMNVIRKMT